jgi:hypothetical protein
MRKRIGEASEPCGRPQRKGLRSSGCCEKVKASVRLVVKEQVHLHRSEGMPHYYMTCRRRAGFVLLKAPSMLWVSKAG